MLSIVVKIFIYSDWTLCACRAGRKHSNIIPRISSSINIGRYINILSPINTLNSDSFIEVPNLQLILCSIAASQNLAILKIKWLACNIGTIASPNSFSLPEVPNIDDRIPTSRDEGSIINKFHCKYTIIVTNMIPACFMQHNGNCLCLLFIDSDVAVFSCCCEKWTTSTEIYCVYCVVLFSHLEKFFKTWDMPVLERSFRISCYQSLKSCINHWPPL